jgi:SAM-dependent methyltransferase
VWISALDEAIGSHCQLGAAKQALDGADMVSQAASGNSRKPLVGSARVMTARERIGMSAEAMSTIVDQRNASFWNELCGTHFARAIGVVDDSPASLKKFDDWYFAYYPYLFIHIPFEEMRDKDVLEVGLGYGAVSQRVAEVGARYEGLDMAAGPVSMANYRLRQQSLAGTAREGSILKAPFSNDSFDYVIAIGCLHHTGDLGGAIEECRRILRPGGKLVFMVYYAYSYRRIFNARRATLRYMARELLGRREVVGMGDARERAAYDVNSEGADAPHTDWISIRSLRSLCRKFSAFQASLENIDNGRPFDKSPARRELLKTVWPRWFGLDLYATATK